jgi:CubicO group peptidase (beta-lactamase class C family)
MAELKVEIDPADVGFDATRLARIDTHFARYVDDGRLPGWLLLVSRKGHIVHLATNGQRDMEAGLPIELDTLFRIYSMTKPITSVAAMMLYEEGGFELKDPVHRYIPSFKDVRVYRQGSALASVTEAATEPVRVWHLLTHTAGLTYGFHHVHPVDAMYRAAGYEWGAPPNTNLEQCCDDWAGLPLLFQPGAEWNYGVNTDVLGRVIEVVSGMPLDEFLRTRIFEPLGMNETAFFVNESDSSRLAALYAPQPGTRKAMRFDALGAVSSTTPAFLSGGGGLVSSASDYHRFTQMLVNRGELDGVRLLGTRTLRYMARNHLPGGVDLEDFGRPIFAQTTYSGVGFGLGFSVVEDPVKAKVLSSMGDHGWGGAASTAFWIDPLEEITALFLTQLLPSSTHPIRPQLKQLVYQALVD